MRLTAVMDALAGRLRTISGLRVFEWPSGTASPPTAIVGYPNAIDYDSTYGRGSDTITIPVVVLVGKANERTARDELGSYVDGAGTRPIKAVLESGTYTVFDSIRVAGADIDVYELGAVKYLAAIFECEIYGSGSGA